MTEPTRRWLVTGGTGFLGSHIARRLLGDGIHPVLFDGAPLPPDEDDIRDQVTVVDSLSMDAPKTATVAKLLRTLELGETTCLLAIENHDPNVWMSAHIRTSACSLASAPMRFGSGWIRSR